jgi:hypothetical protein
MAGQIAQPFSCLHSLRAGCYNATLILKNLPKQTINIPVTMVVGFSPNNLVVIGTRLTWVTAFM